MLESLQHLDQHVLLFLNGFHAPFWDSFMWIFTGKIAWIPMYATVLYVLYKNFNAYTAIFTVIAIGLTITYADQICATVIRPWVGRMRPSNVNNPLSEFIHILNDKRGGRFGFPSCHSSNSFALAFFIMLFFKKRWLTVFIMCWAVINCYSRIYSGVHYPGDLLAGLVVGMSGAYLIYYLFRYALRQPKIAQFLKYEKDKELIEHPEKIKYTNLIIYAGLATIVIIAIYSLITLWI